TQNEKEIFSHLAERLKSLILVIEEMLRSSELVYIDITTSLDNLNTLLTVISTSTPISGLLLAVILTSDKTISTLTSALEVLKHIMLSTAFSKHRLITRSQAIITNDSSLVRKALCSLEEKYQEFEFYSDLHQVWLEQKQYINTISVTITNNNIINDDQDNDHNSDQDETSSNTSKDNDDLHQFAINEFYTAQANSNSYQHGGKRIQVQVTAIARYRKRLNHRLKK
ncbi:10682_t:CDS:2, partial [Scutellospora calospora]